MHWAASALEDLPRLSFLDCVFKEALRLYPPVYLFGRIATEDTTVAGYPIPKDTILLLCPWSMQRRADLWTNPLRFDPDRFAPEQDKARPRDAWIPFSDGPRVCIGAHFAQLEAPLVLASLLQRADFEPVDMAAETPDESITLRPRGGVRARVKLRAA
jgi:cytochrome P450